MRINISTWSPPHASLAASRYMRRHLLETDTSKMSKCITAARCAILGRIEEILKKPVQGEHRALGDARRQYSD
jgi:hypothetical protein